MYNNVILLLKEYICTKGERIMTEKYITPAMEIVAFDAEDVITTSGGGEFEGPEVGI